MSKPYIEKVDGKLVIEYDGQVSLDDDEDFAEINCNIVEGLTVTGSHGESEVASRIEEALETYWAERIAQQVKYGRD